MFFGPLRQGAEQAGRTLSDLELVAPVAVEIHDDEASADAAARRHADGYAFTIGAMGVGGRNFYNDAFTRLGYGDEVAGRRRAVASRRTRRSAPCRATRPRPADESAWDTGRLETASANTGRPG